MEDKIECIGKGVFTLIMGLICLTMAIYLLIITIKMEQIIVLAYLIVILAFGLAIYYLLYCMFLNLVSQTIVSYIIMVNT